MSFIYELKLGLCDIQISTYHKLIAIVLGKQINVSILCI